MNTFKKPIFVRDNTTTQPSFLKKEIVFQKHNDLKHLLESNKYCGKGRYTPKPFIYYTINGEKRIWWGKGKYPTDFKEVIEYEKQNNPDGVSLTELRYILKYCSLKTQYRLLPKYPKELIEKYIPYI